MSIAAYVCNNSFSGKCVFSYVYYSVVTGKHALQRKSSNEITFPGNESLKYSPSSLLCARSTVL